MGGNVSAGEQSAVQLMYWGIVCVPLLGPPFPAPDAGVVPHSRAPVLFLVGGMDPQDPFENVEAAPASLPNAQILVVPGAGHGSLRRSGSRRPIARAQPPCYHSLSRCHDPAAGNPQGGDGSVP